MRIAIFTSGRHDWGILEPLVQAMERTEGLDPVIMASGIHFRSGQWPATLGDLPVAAHVDTLQASDHALAVAQTAGWTTALIAGHLLRLEVDALLLLGDRTETLAAGLAALCLRIPIIHLHGGEETEGAIDNLCRHALSKMSALHFVAHPSFARRLEQMGEDPGRIIVSGALGLDALHLRPLLGEQDLAAHLELPRLPRPLAVFTFHPAPLDVSARPFTDVLGALEDWLTEGPGPFLVATRPNQDEGGNRLWDALQAFAAHHPGRVRPTESLGPIYPSLLSHADLMVGNSSSGIIEAPSFGLPVVNIGDRQKGRMRGENVIDVPQQRDAILLAMSTALDPGFRARCKAAGNPYGDGRATERIQEALLRFAPELANLGSRKAFHDASTPH